MNLYKVKPLFGQLLEDYCPAVDRYNKPSPASYYPATLFLQRILNATAWTMDNEGVYPNDNWTNAIKADLERLNPGKGLQAWNYLTLSSNGVWFNNGLNICVYPNDTVNILQVKDRPQSAGKHWGLGEYWGKVETVPYTTTAPDFSTLPDYLFSYQSDENSLMQVLMAKDDKGLNMRFPRFSRDELWINMDCVEQIGAPQTEDTVTLTVTCTLNIRSAPTLSGSVVGQRHDGDTFHISNLVVADGIVWGQDTTTSPNGWSAVNAVYEK